MAKLKRSVKDLPLSKLKFPASLMALEFVALDTHPELERVTKVHEPQTGSQLVVVEGTYSACVFLHHHNFIRCSGVVVEGKMRSSFGPYQEEMSPHRTYRINELHSSCSNPVMHALFALGLVTDAELANLCAQAFHAERLVRAESDIHSFKELAHRHNIPQHVVDTINDHIIPKDKVAR